MDTDWAKRPLDASVTNTLSALRQAYPVVLIATCGEDLIKCPEEDRSQLEGETLAEFDFVPTTRENRISGIYDRTKQRIVPLHEDMLLPATSSLLGFIERADELHFSLIVADREIIGIVTLSDLQQLPVFHVLFGLLVSVEMLLVDWIRLRCKDDKDEWLHKLAPSEQIKVERFYAKAVARNVALDKLSVASFQQEIDCAELLGLFANDPTQLTALRSLKELRNQVCHGMDIARDVKRALEIPARVRETFGMIARLQTELGNITLGTHSNV